MATLRITESGPRTTVTESGPRVSITDKIQYAMSQAISNYGANLGWELCYFPKQNQLYLNVP